MQNDKYETSRSVPGLTSSQLLDVLISHGGRADLNQLLIGMYRIHGRIIKRYHATTVIQRLKKKGKVEVVSTSSKKYRLYQLRKES